MPIYLSAFLCMSDVGPSVDKGGYPPGGVGVVRVFRMGGIGAAVALWPTGLRPKLPSNKARWLQAISQRGNGRGNYSTGRMQTTPRVRGYVYVIVVRFFGCGGRI